MDIDDEDGRLAAEIGELLGRRTVATAESMTAGLIAQRLAAVEGSMEWFRGGVVAYQRHTKQHVLGVEPGPVVTAPVACQMAAGAASMLDADVAVSVTGAAGPDPLDGADPGTVFIGVWADGRSRAFQHCLSGTAEPIIASACTAALTELAACLRAEQ